MDSIAFMQGLGAANHAVAILRGLGDTLKTAGKMEAISQAVEAQLKIMDVLQKYQELQNENFEQGARIRELTESLEVKSKLQFHHQSYWIPREDGSLDGPFSTHSWDTKGKLVRMQLREWFMIDEENRAHFTCLECDKKHSYVPLRFIQENQVIPANEIDPRPPPSGIDVIPRRSRGLLL